MITATRAHDVAPAPLKFIWRNRIPIGNLSIVAGSPGMGKSSLVSVVAAELTRAGRTVLLSNCEDDLASVTRPRLDVAGAILDRVHLIEPENAPVLPRDLDGLGDLIRERKAHCLILDPIGAHFRPERFVHDRASLRDLVRLARWSGCAIIGVHHTTKTGAVGGPNGGLIGTARAVYLYGYDPNHVDRRLLSCLKMNASEVPAALVFEHETVEYERHGVVLEAGFLRKLRRESNERAQRRPARRDMAREAEAHQWLSEYLASGEDCARRSADVRLAGREAGFGWDTLKRCKATLMVESTRKGGVAGSGWWVWRLPSDHPLRDPEFIDEARAVIGDLEPVT